SSVVDRGRAGNAPIGPGPSKHTSQLARANHFVYCGFESEPALVGNSSGSAARERKCSRVRNRIEHAASNDCPGNSKGSSCVVDAHVACPEGRTRAVGDQDSAVDERAARIGVAAPKYEEALF